MGRDALYMVEAVMFMGTVMLACVTVLVIGVTVLLTLMGCDLAMDLWKKVKRR